MEQLKSILQKIEQTIASPVYSSIEKDLLLQHTRDLYEAIQATNSQHTEPILVAEPEPAAAIIAQQQEAVKIEEVKQVEKKETPVTNTAGNRPAPSPKSTEQKAGLEIIHSIFEDDRETMAEKMSFELEPELQADKDQPLFKTPASFKVWNKDIRTHIGINDKYNFISALFRGNNEAYEEILNEINNCTNAKDALLFLENSGITTLYKWDNEGVSEQIFYNTLSQFFSSR